MPVTNCVLGCAKMTSDQRKATAKRLLDQTLDLMRRCPMPEVHYCMSRERIEEIRNTEASLAESIKDLREMAGEKAAEA